MSKRQVLMVLGVWVAVLLFLGFPSSWDKLIAVVSGLLVLFVAYRLNPDAKPRSADPMPYVEHKNTPPRQSSIGGDITNPNPPAAQ